MKRFLLLFFGMLATLASFAQTGPYITGRGFKIPTNATDSSWVSGVASNGTVAAFYVTSTGRIRYYNPVTDVWCYLDNSTAGTVLPISDATALLKDNSDATKLALFELSGLTTATTRTYTLPDANIVVAGSASALTSGRLAYTTTGGLLTGSSNGVYNGTNLTLSGGAYVLKGADNGFTAGFSFQDVSSQNILRIFNNGILGFGTGNNALLGASSDGVNHAIAGGGHLLTGSAGSVLSIKYTNGGSSTVTGTVTMLSVPAGNIIFAPSSGTSSFTGVNIRPNLNTTGTYSGTVIGFDWTPTLTSVTGLTNLSFRSSSGSMLLAQSSSDVVTSSTRLDVRGTSTGADYVIRAASSANSEVFAVQSNGIVRGNLYYSSGNSSAMDVRVGRDVANGITFQTQNNYDVASTTRAMMNLAPSFSWTSGTNSGAVLRIAQTNNITGGTTTLRGIYYTPTNTSLTGVTHRAIETTSGDILFGNAGSITGTATGNIDFTSNTSSSMAVSSNSIGVSTSGSSMTAFGSLPGASTINILSSGNATVSHDYTLASGSTTYNSFTVTPTINMTGGTNTVYGINYNPSVSGTTGLTHIGLNIQSGEVRFPAVTQDDTKTRIAALDATTGKVFWRDASTLGGGGFTNTATNTELAMSDGTNLDPSGIFIPSAGSLDLGTGLAGGTRIVTAKGTASDINLDLYSKGVGSVRFNAPGGGGVYGYSAGAIGTGNAYAGFVYNGSSFTNSSPYFSIENQTSGSAATGIGVGINFRIKEGSGSYEVGTSIESVATDVTNGSEDFDFVVKNMAAGAAATERLRIASTGEVTNIIGSTTYKLIPVLENSATLDFSSTLAQADSDLTITVTGAVVGDEVSLGIPNGSVVSGGTFTAWVSASDTVTVRFSNYSSSAKDPASGTFKVNVHKN